IIGPRENNKQSVLWPGKYSLVPNMIGLFGVNPNGTNQVTVPTDRHPFNGGFGINIISGPNGQPILDQNFNGIDDSTEPALAGTYFDMVNNVNLSGAVQIPLGTAQTQSRQAIYQNFPSIDVGYTYPDINNLFLAFDGSISVGAAAGPTTYRLVT